MRSASCSYVGACRATWARVELLALVGLLVLVARVGLAAAGRVRVGTEAVGLLVLVGRAAFVRLTAVRLAAVGLAAVGRVAARQTCR